MPESSNNLKRVDFALSFDGEPAEVEARTFVTAILSVAEILDELSIEYGVGEQLNIRVRAPEPGSLLLPLSLVPPEIIDTIKSLFTSENLKLAYDLIRTLGVVFGLRKHLKKSKPEVVHERDGNVEVKNNSGSIVVVDKRVYNIYINNPTVNTNLNRIFQSLERDKSITTFEICDREGKSIFNAQRNEFGELSQGLSLDTTTHMKTERISLNIVKVSFDEKLKWEFIYRGKRIPMHMKDEEYAGKIDRGIEKFSKGDYLEVELQIEQVYDSDQEVFVNKEYSVLKVHNHKRGSANQSTLNLAGD